jgi:hypothetical protein
MLNIVRRDLGGRDKHVPIDNSEVASMGGVEGRYRKDKNF